ncbi:MAG TPA: hypothetical protein VK498_02555, partial [Ferruginibacter sp.]|nr:hypothetical protein [Ferruginibacter sp.]
MKKFSILITLLVLSMLPVSEIFAQGKKQVSKKTTVKKVTNPLPKAIVKSIIIPGPQRVKI